MTRISGILFFIFFQIGYCFNQLKPITEEIKEIAASEMKSCLNFLNLNSSIKNSFIDLNYCRFKLKVEVETPYLHGEITYYYSYTENTQKIMLELTDSLQVDSIIYHHTAIVFKHENNQLEINLYSTQLSGTKDSITIFYEGDPAKTNNSFQQSFHNEGPIIWTLSEPYGSKDWWPCIQNLNDKIDSIDIIVTVSPKYKVASNGILLNVEKGLHNTYYWKHRYPIAYYLIAIAITDYYEYSEFVSLSNGKNLEVQNFIYPGNTDSIKYLTSALLPALQYFDSLFMVYPFYNEKYGQAQFGRGGGMEHQTITFVGRFNYNLLVHELAHQWFGNYITCSTWQDIWINEGFATYAELLAFEKFYPDSLYLSILHEFIDNITSYNNGSVWVEDTTSVNRIFNYRLSYLKGAYLLHMIRWELGDELFFKGLHNYLNDPNLAFKNANMKDFKSHLENATDTTLTEFFNDWYYGQGYPAYTIKWFQDNELNLHIKINQVSSHYSVNFFEMHLPLKLNGINNDSLIRIHHVQNNEEFIIKTGFFVKDLQFDPFFKILTPNPLITNEKTDVEGLTLFPNPFHEKIYVLKQEHVEVNDILIYDINGNLVFKSKFKNELVLKNLPIGIYFININTNTNNYKFKVIKY